MTAKTIFERLYLVPTSRTPSIFPFCHHALAPTTTGYFSISVQYQLANSTGIFGQLDSPVDSPVIWPSPGTLCITCPPLQGSCTHRFCVYIKPQNTSIMVWLPWKSKKKALETTEKSRETQECSPKKSAATREPEAAAPKAGGASGWTSKTLLS